MNLWSLVWQPPFFLTPVLDILGSMTYSSLISIQGVGGSVYVCVLDILIILFKDLFWLKIAICFLLLRMSFLISILILNCWPITCSDRFSLHWRGMKVLISSQIFQWEIWANHASSCLGFIKVLLDSELPLQKSNSTCYSITHFCECLIRPSWK